MVRTKLTGILICCLLLLANLTAGIYIEGTDTQTMQGEKHTTKIFVEEQRLRIETSGQDDNMVIIFRDDKDLFWVLDMEKKNYREMTKEDVKQMRVKLDEGMKKMQEQLKNLPPEQRKMMEQMMPAPMPSQEIEQTVYAKQKSGIKVQNWECTHYIGEVKGKKKQELWTTAWDQLGVSGDELAVFRSMGEFFSLLAPDMTDVFKIGDPEFEKNGGFAGMPVKSKNYEDGKVVSEFEVKKISRQDIKPALFEIPKGYKKQANEWQGM